MNHRFLSSGLAIFVACQAGLAFAQSSPPAGPGAGPAAAPATAPTAAFDPDLMPPTAVQAAAAREGRTGRIFVGTLAGFAAGFAGNIVAYNLFANLCGDGGFGLPTPGNISDNFSGATGCLIGYAVVNLVAYMFIVPWGVDGAGDGMNGLGTYGAALYGSVGGMAAAFAPGPQIGFGTAVFIGSFLAPPMAVMGYEFSSFGREQTAGPAVSFAPYAAPLMRDHELVGAVVGLSVATF